MMIDAKYKSQFYIDETNSATGAVIRWNSNDRIPFEDMLQNFVDAGWITAQELRNSVEQRVAEDRVAIEQYRKNRRAPSAEELFEMRAAFGAGAIVVDALTGEVYRLAN
jgi:hypothetical protein